MVKKVFYIFFFFLFPLAFLYPQWQLIGLDGEDVKKILVHPKDSQIIFAGSANVGSSSMGGFFVSNDSGSSWDTLITGISVTDFVIDYQNPSIIYVALGGNSPTGSGIIKTTDGGNGWISSGSGIDVNWETGLKPIAIDPINPNVLYCGTVGPMGGNLFKTTDAGLNWFKPSADTFLFDIGVAVIEFDKYNPALLYIGRAMNGTLFRSTNGGVNFEFAGYENGGAIKNLKFGRNSDEIFVTSFWSFAYPVGIFKTTDGGITWQNIGEGFDGTVDVGDVALKFTNKEYIYIGAATLEDTSGVYVKVNNGPWEIIGLDNKFIKSLLIKDEILYAGTNEGVFATDLITNVEEEGHTNKEKSFIIYPNYPNPFNNTTTIRFTVPLDAEHAVSLRVYDILGNEVATLVDEQKPAGTYEVEFDETNLSSGIYIYRLNSGKFTTSKKLILLK